ncbi:hypothetical protein [Psychrobacillus sp.]|uniref:hypothetical protein n=1 Tax=Psychrobacillus sp. TaxID=1871623 RepID=UPI0028BE339D|nr:hypothetical protein [Psychrobacillus sp.]
MTTVATKLSGGKILLLNNFSWISQPNFTLTDVVAVTHSASAVKIPGTEGFSYTYRDAYGLHSVAESSTTRNSYGIAKTFNLKSFGADSPPYDHTGYVSVQVEKGNTGDTKANAYGHYSHTTVRIGTSVSVSIPKAGSINITGQLSKTDMPDSMVLFNY